MGSDLQINSVSFMPRIQLFNITMHIITCCFNVFNLHSTKSYFIPFCFLGRLYHLAICRCHAHAQSEEAASSESDTQYVPVLYKFKINFHVPCVPKEPRIVTLRSKRPATRTEIIELRTNDRSIKYDV